MPRRCNPLVERCHPTMGATDPFPTMVPFGMLTGALGGWFVAMARGRKKGTRLAHVAVGALSGMGVQAFNALRVSRWARDNPYGEIATSSPLWRLSARAQQESERARLENIA